MIYATPPADAPLTQGDVINDCPLIFWTAERENDGTVVRHSATSNERIVVLSQACDLANAKTSRVQVAVAYSRNCWWPMAS